MTVEVALVQQLAALLAPALPYLMGPATIAGQKVAEAIGGKIGEDAWSTTKEVWRKLQPWVDKDPGVAKALKEVADGDPLARDALPRDLKKLLDLEGLPIDALDEVRSIVNENVSETHITTASSGGLAVEGNLIQGISYQDARQIALDAYKNNIPHLVGDAHLLAGKRAAHLSDQFLFHLSKNNPKSIASLADPGMQIDLLYNPGKWDVFICYASEDKEDLARPLAESLTQAGLKVWFDSF